MSEKQIEAASAQNIAIELPMKAIAPFPSSIEETCTIDIRIVEYLIV